MSAYSNEKIENAICFFAREHYQHTRRYPTQTHIYKYLAFFDFQLLEETGQAPLDLKYLAMKYGPVPIEVYSKRRKIESELFVFDETQTGKIYVKTRRAPDLSYFAVREIKKMRDLIFIFASAWTSANIMSESSHQKIGAWVKTWSRRPNSLINKADTFEELQSKSDEELSPQEEHFLIAEALKRAGK